MIRSLFNRKCTWIVIDCLSRKAYELSESKTSIGTNHECRLISGEDSLTIENRSPDPSGVFINGYRLNDPVEIPPSSEHFIKAGSAFYLVMGGPHPQEWAENLDLSRWLIQDVSKNKIIATAPFEQIPQTIRQLGANADHLVSTVVGAGNAMYVADMFPHEVFSTAENERAVATPPLPVSGATHAEPVEINTAGGEFTCPHCWMKFDRGDVMWVARHPNLRDPDLGDEFPLRFFPTTFDEYGRAVDAMGVKCTDMACPTCKSRLPPQFLDVPSHIFSIVGAPSAGKSYFLTSMIHQLHDALPMHLGLSFQDGDASGNAVLSDMRARLFSGSSNPADIALDKTVPGGEMFKTWERDGRSVKLPKPFTYLVSPFSPELEDQDSLHLVFYDNAGEQFEPSERVEGAESLDEDTTRHLATSDVIFFLYDPATNVKFRQKISKQDPQVSDDRFLKLNRQDNIISEMRIRIKSELFLDGNEKLDVPLAMIIGKCDLWADLLSAPLIHPLTPEGFSLEAVAHNSDVVRKFMMQTSPGVVGHAESISKEVVYFPASPIGHSPQVFIPADGRGERIGPVPGKVDPRYPEIPVIWALARLHPELIKISHQAVAVP